MRIYVCAGVNMADLPPISATSSPVKQERARSVTSGTTGVVSTGNTLGTAPMAPNEVSDRIAALLSYNKLPVKDLFQDFDVDGDGKVSMTDLLSAAATAKLEVTESDLQMWHAHYHTAGDGLMTLDEWILAFKSADPEGVLKSRGVSIHGSAGVNIAVIDGASTDMTSILRVSEAIVASLKHNDLGIHDAFGAFDVDEDGVLSLDDLIKAADSLQLDLQDAQLQGFLAHIEHLGGGKSADDQIVGWQQILSQVDGTSVLKARGLMPQDPPVDTAPSSLLEAPPSSLLAGEIAARAPAQLPAPTTTAEAPAAAQNPSSQDTLPEPAAPTMEAAAPVQVTHEGAPAQPVPVQQHTAEGAAAVPVQQSAAVPEALAEAAARTATPQHEATIPQHEAATPQHEATAATLQHEAATLQHEPATPQHEAAATATLQHAPAAAATVAAAPVSAPALPSAKAVSTAAAASPVASAPHATPTTKEISWETAVPLTLTLDMDFDSISDYEA